MMEEARQSQHQGIYGRLQTTNISILWTVDSLIINIYSSASYSRSSGYFVCNSIIQKTQKDVENRLGET